jgi:hypothetical protein
MEPISVTWPVFKAHVITMKGLPFQDIVDTAGIHNLIGAENNIQICCRLAEDSADADWVDYSSNFMAQANAVQRISVTTAFETRDKTLRSVCGFEETDESGVAEYCFPIPASHGGRWIAYGDAEFQVRHMGDYVAMIEEVDLDGIIPEEARAAFPSYPSLGWYEERELPNPLPPSTKGDIKGGIAMTFQYGSTEAQPIGGYGWLDGYLYLRIRLKKAADAPTLPGKTGQAGYKSAVSIDWAENDA